jgi:aldose 1-epimerase family protein, lacX
MKIMINDIKSINIKGEFFENLVEWDFVSDKKDERISFRFHSKYLSIWSKTNAGDFVCIEPWDGLPDFEKPNLELSKKEGINSLKPGEEYLFSYEMEFID